jgi:hypothetical protein
MASLATAGQSCVIPGSNGVQVVYTRFDLAFLPAGAGGVDEAGVDGGGQDAASPPDASTGSEGGSPEGGAIDYSHLDWQFGSTFTDAVKTCTSTLHYTLVRD